MEDLIDLLNDDDIEENGDGNNSDDDDNHNEEEDNNNENKHKNEEQHNEEEEKNQVFTLIINGVNYYIDKKSIMQASLVIHDHINNNPESDSFSIQIQDAESFSSIIPTFFTKTPSLIDKYNYHFLRDFSQTLQISELQTKIDNFASNLTILKESTEMRDLIECEKIIFSITDSNIEEKVTEASQYFEGESSNIFNFARSLYFASISFPYKLDLYFDFMERLESVNIFIFKEYSKLPLLAFKRSKTPSIYLENCNEVSFIILKLLELGIIQDQDVKDLKICLPKIFSHINDQEWVEFLHKNEIGKSYFNTHFDELYEDDWKLHKKLAIEGNDVNPIVEIIRNDDFDCFQNLMSQTNLNLREVIKMTFYIRSSFLKDPSLIEIAAFFSAIKIFKFLLLNNVPITKKLSHYAVAGGNFEIIHICEDNNCDFEDTLQIAIRFHQNEIFGWLVETKGVLESSPDQFDLWENCARYGNYSVMKKMIKLGVDPSPLVSELICFRQPDVAKIILQLKGIDINIAEKETKGTPLHFACRRKMADIVKVLLTFDNVNVNAKAAYDTYPIHSACRSNNFDVVKLLLDRDDININDCKTKPPHKNQEMSPIQSAAKHGHAMIVKMLIAHPMCDINCKNFVFYLFIFLISFFYYFVFEMVFIKLIFFNFGILHSACCSYSTEIVEFLLKCPFIDINARGILIFLFF